MFFPFSNKISSHNSTISSTPRGSCENLVFSCSHNLASGVSVRTEPKRALVATDRNVSRVEKEFRSRSKVLFDPKSDIIVIVVITGSDTKVTGSCSEWKTKNVSVASTVIEPSSRFCQKIRDFLRNRNKTENRSNDTKPENRNETNGATSSNICVSFLSAFVTSYRRSEKENKVEFQWTTSQSLFSINLPPLLLFFLSELLKKKE